MNLKIVKMGINGEGIGYIDRKPVFVDGCFVDEEVEVKDIKEYKGYCKATLVKIIKKSYRRIEPRCHAFEKCHACSLMAYKYDSQLAFKRDILKESLIKYAQVDPKLIEATRPTKRLYYRNQCKLPLKMIKRQLQSGMYEANSNHLVYLSHCIIHEEGLEEVRKHVMKVLNDHGCRDYNEKIQKGYRYLVIRGFDGKYQVTLVTGNTTIEQAIIDDILSNPKVTSVYQNINLSKDVTIMSDKFKHLAKDKTLKVSIDDIEMELYPNSFFQLNIEQAKNIYHDVIDMIGNPELMVEAYCGIGAMSLLASKKCRKIIAIESVKNAIENAKENARINNIDNIKFVCDDAGKAFSKIKEKIDVLLVDPPRTGLDQKMLNTIMEYEPEKIIYVSCNPSTLAKNIKVLKDKYVVKKVIPYDLFAQTPHVESLVLLQRK